MKNKLFNDKKKRTLSLQSEKKRFILKSITKNNVIYKSTRWNSELKLTKFDANNFFNRFVNRCILTGRKNKFNGKFKFSRLTFLKLARSGFINGLTKSSW